MRAPAALSREPASRLPPSCYAKRRVCTLIQVSKPFCSLKRHSTTIRQGGIEISYPLAMLATGAALTLITIRLRSADPFIPSKAPSWRQSDVDQCRPGLQARKLIREPEERFMGRSLSAILLTTGAASGEARFDILPSLVIGFVMFWIVVGLIGIFTRGRSEMLFWPLLFM